jgi:O-antigen/teichoic acid export membrane protein
VIGREFPPLIFAAFFGATATGFYALAHHVLSKPMALIGGAVGQVFFSNAVESNRNGTLPLLVSSLHEKLAHVTMPPMVLLIFKGPELFGLVFGSKWTEAGVYAQWMAPWIYFMCVSSPLSTILTVLEKQKVTLAFQLLLFLLRILAIAVGVQSGDMLVTVKIFSVANSIAYFILFIIIAKVSKCSLSLYLNAMLMALVISGLCMLPLGFDLISNEFMLDAGTYPVLVVMVLIGMRYGYMMKESY